MKYLRIIISILLLVFVRNFLGGSCSLVSAVNAEAMEPKATVQDGENSKTDDSEIDDSEASADGSDGDDLDIEDSEGDDSEETDPVAQNENIDNSDASNETTDDINGSVQNNLPAIIVADQQVISKVISITNEQKELQKEIEEDLEKPQTRNKFLLRIIGPDFAEIKKINEHLLNEKEKTQEMRTLMDEIQNPGAKSMAAQMLGEVTKKDSVYEQKLSARKDVSSLFGWLVKFFY